MNLGFPQRKRQLEYGSFFQNMIETDFFSVAFRYAICFYISAFLPHQTRRDRSRPTTWVRYIDGGISEDEDTSFMFMRIAMNGILL